MMIEASQIVLGDIVCVRGGDIVPCDMVLFKSNEMSVSNTALTGVSEEVIIDINVEPCRNILETQNVAFLGALCTAGSGTGICIKTGNETVLG